MTRGTSGRSRAKKSVEAKVEKLQEEVEEVMEDLEELSMESAAPTASKAKRSKSKKSSKKKSRKSSKKYVSEMKDTVLAVTAQGTLVQLDPTENMVIPAHVLKSWRCDIDSRFRAVELQTFLEGSPGHRQYTIKSMDVDKIDALRDSRKGGSIAYYHPSRLLKKLGSKERCEDSDFQTMEEDFLEKLELLDEPFRADYFCGLLKDNLTFMRPKTKHLGGNMLGHAVSTLCITSRNVSFPLPIQLAVEHLSMVLPFQYDRMRRELRVYGAKLEDLFFWQDFVFNSVVDNELITATQPLKFRPDEAKNANTTEEYVRAMLAAHFVKVLGDKPRDYRWDRLRQAFQGYRRLRRLMMRYHEKIAAFNKEKAGNNFEKQFTRVNCDSANPDQMMNYAREDVTAVPAGAIAAVTAFYAPLNAATIALAGSVDSDQITGLSWADAKAQLNAVKGVKGDL